MNRRPPKEEDSVPLILEDSHLSDEALELYCLCQLHQEEEIALVEEHLLYCSYCQERLEKTQQYIDSVKEANRRLENSHPSDGPAGKGGNGGKLRNWALIGIAAALTTVFFVPRWLDSAAPPLAFSLVSYRDQSALEAPAGRPLDLKLDLAGLSAPSGFAYRLLSPQAQILQQGALSLAAPNFVSPPLAAGPHWIQVRDQSTGALLREFSLRVR